VRVIQRGEDFRLALEARQPLRIRRKEIRQDLDRDVALEPRVAGPIDLAHAASADGSENFVRAETSADAQGH